MKYLLDTNTCIRHLNRRSPSITEHLHTTPEPDIAICSVVKAELYLGAMKSQFPDKTMQKQQAFASRFVSLPFDDTAALVYARTRGKRWFFSFAVRKVADEKNSITGAWHTIVKNHHPAICV